MDRIYLGDDFDSFDKLYGWMIEEALYDDGSIYLTLHGGEKKVILEPYGECCAHCYIQHVDGAEFLKNGVVLEVQEIDGGYHDSGNYVVESWGHRIRTDKGICSIEMRVEHNGYYGGHLEIRSVSACVGKTLEDF